MTSLPPDRDPFASPSASLGLDVLPPELEGIQRDLIADAAQWERGVPPAARFNQRLHTMLPLDTAVGATNRSSPGMRTRAPGEAVNAPRRMPPALPAPNAAEHSTRPGGDGGRGGAAGRGGRHAPSA